MRKKLILKIIGTGVCTAALLSVIHILIGICVARRIDLQTTYIASRDIMPRTQITEEDLIEVKIPQGYLLDHAYTEKEDIIGKYTEIQGMIPAGSVFYKSMLYDASELPDHPVLQLKAGQTSYVLQTDPASLASITPGQRVNIHVSIDSRDSAPVTGCLITHARIIAVRDHQGISVLSPESTGVPYTVEIAVNTADLQIITMAEMTGEIRVFASDESYRTDAEAEIDETSDLTQYLRRMMNQPES